MVDAALLRARVEVQNVRESSRELDQFGNQIGTTAGRARGASGDFDALGRSTGQSGQAAGQAARGYGSLRQGVDQLSPVALGATGAVVGLGLAAKSSVDASIQWESALAGVAKTLDQTGLTAAQAEAAVADIGAELRQMAQETPISAVELAGVAEAAGQLGVARDEVIHFTETMALLGVATDLTAEQSATAIARIQAVTGLAGSEVDNFAAALVALGNNSAATESEILNFATRLAAAGTNAGFTEGEILGLSAAMASVGLNAEAGSTAAIQAMNEITVSVAMADERLSAFAEIAGMSAEEFARAWRTNAAAAFADFVEGLGQVEARGQDTVLVLDELGLDGIRVSQALNSLAGAGDLTADSFARGNEEFAKANAHLVESERRFATTASEVQLAKNRMNDAAIVLGDELAPAYVYVIELTADFVTAMAEATTGVGKFKRGVEDLDVKTVGSSLIDLGEAMGLVIRDFGQVQDETSAVAEEMVFWANVMNLVNEEIARFSTVYGPTYAEYVRAVKLAADATEKTSDTVETWLRLQHESAIRALGVADTVQDQTQAVAENDLALSGLIDTSHAAAQAALAEAQARAAQRDVLFDIASALDGLEGAYVSAGDAASIFNAQGSEYTSIAGDLEDAYDAIIAKKERNEDLSAAEIALLERYPELFGRLEGAQEDATIQAGLWAAAQAELIVAQDAVAAGLDDAPAKLASAARSIQTATDETGVMTDAQRDLLESILNVGVGLDGLDGQEANIAVNLLEGAGSTADQRGGQTRFEQRAEDLGISGRVRNIGSSLGDLDGSSAEVEALLDDSDATTKLDNLDARVQALDGDTFTIFANIDTSGVDAAVQYIDDSLPHSPARRGPLSREANWDFLFEGLTGSAFKYTDEATGVIADVGKDHGRTYGENFELEFGLVWNAMWTDAAQYVEGLFRNDPLELFSGDALAQLEGQIEAQKAVLDALLEAGFSPDSPAYKEALERYEQLLLDLQVLTAVAGTDAAEAYWREWGSENLVKRHLAGTLNVFDEFGVTAGEFFAERFWDGFSSGIQRPGPGPGGILDSIIDGILPDPIGVEIEFDIKGKDNGGGGSGRSDEGNAFVEVVTALAEEGLAQLQEIFDEYPEAATRLIDDLAAAIDDGRLTFSQALELIGEIPAETLIPALERLEEQLTVDLAEALLQFGPGSPEVQAILASLELIAAAADAAGGAISGLNEEQQALIQGASNVTATGDGGAGLAGGGGPGTPEAPGAGAPTLYINSANMGALWESGGDVGGWLSANIAHSRSIGQALNVSKDLFDATPADIDAIINDVLTSELGPNFYGYHAPGSYDAGGISIGGAQLAQVSGNPSGIEAHIPLERAGEFGFGGLSDADAERIGRSIAKHLTQTGQPVIIQLTSPMDGRVLEQHVVDVNNRHARGTLG